MLNAFRRVSVGRWILGLALACCYCGGGCFHEHHDRDRGDWHDGDYHDGDYHDRHDEHRDDHY